MYLLCITLFRLIRSWKERLTSMWRGIQLRAAWGPQWCV